MYQSNLVRISSGAAAAVALLANAAAAAQAQPTNDPQQASGMAALEEVVVTAQKREQSLQDVPISIDVFSGESLERLNVVRFEDLAGYLPNFYVKETPGNNAIYVRGIGSSPGTLALEQSVSMFVDGVYAGRGRQFQEPFLDVERVEVMLGPQGGLVGKNTSAGALNVITRRPTRDHELSLSGSYEFEYESYDLTAIASGPLTDTFAARIAAKYSDMGGFITNPGPAYGGDKFPTEENVAVRASGLWTPSDTVQVTARVGFSQFDQFGNTYETLGPTQAGGMDDLDLENASDTLAGGPDKDETRAKNAAITVDWDIGEHRLTAITGYSDYDMEKLVDGDFTANRIFGARFFEDYEQLSQEVRLISPGTGRFEYILGAYYHEYDLTVNRQSVFNLGRFVGESIRVFDQEDSLTSAFAQGTWKFTDTLRTNATLRYTQEDKDARLRRTTLGVVPPTQLTSPIDASRSEDQVDPAVSVQWDIAPSTMLYAAFTRGSKGGGFEGESATTTPATFEFQDEQSESIELGAKMDFGIATLNLTVYRTEFDDLQVSVLQTTPIGFQTVIRNAAQARSTGAELNGALRATESLRLAASLAYNEGEYTDFPNGLCVYPRNAPNCIEDISGTPLPHAPRWSGNTRLTYQRPVADNLSFTLDGAVAYKSATYLSESLDPRCRREANAKIDLRVGLESAAGWQVGLLGKNLSDEQTANHCFETPALGAQGFRSYYDELPRTIALELGLQF